MCFAPTWRKVATNFQRSTPIEPSSAQSLAMHDRPDGHGQRRGRNEASRPGWRALQRRCEASQPHMSRMKIDRAASLVFTPASRRLRSRQTGFCGRLAPAHRDALADKKMRHAVDPASKRFPNRRNAHRTHTILARAARLCDSCNSRSRWRVSVTSTERALRA